MQSILPLKFNPQLILYQAGVDGLATDALGKLNITRKGMNERNKLVFDMAVKIRYQPLSLWAEVTQNQYLTPLMHSATCLLQQLRQTTVLQILSNE